jgi:uncharacterized protein (UPF0276 family)
VAAAEDAAVAVGDPAMSIESQSKFRDRVGIGWRSEIAAGILSNLDRIDVLEVIADDLFDASPKTVRAIRTLGSQVPLILHGVSLGMASASPVEPGLLEKTARLVDRLSPECWSEHLAFVRGGGVEIGHLAAPPRTDETIEGACANFDRARRVVGASLRVENIATLIDPPASSMDEASWVEGILNQSGCDLLLDLHNLHANASNFGFEATAFLDRLPANRITGIHLAGGRWIGRPGSRRLLDDHQNDVPDPVYDLLVEVARRAPQPLTTILERDGAFPPIESLLAELDRARRALALGRSRRLGVAGGQAERIGEVPAGRDAPREQHEQFSTVEQGRL